MTIAAREHPLADGHARRAQRAVNLDDPLEALVERESASGDAPAWQSEALEYEFAAETTACTGSSAATMRPRARLVQFRCRRREAGRRRQRAATPADDADAALFSAARRTRAGGGSRRATPISTSPSIPSRTCCRCCCRSSSTPTSTTGTCCRSPMTRRHDARDHERHRGRYLRRGDGISRRRIRARSELAHVRPGWRGGRERQGARRPVSVAPNVALDVLHNDEIEDDPLHPRRGCEPGLGGGRSLPHGRRRDGRQRRRAGGEPPADTRRRRCACRGSAWSRRCRDYWIPYVPRQIAAQLAR